MRSGLASVPRGPSNNEGHYPLYPRAAYYALKEVHEIEVYGDDVTAEGIDSFIEEISLGNALRKAENEGSLPLDE